MRKYAKIAPYYDRFINKDFYKGVLDYLRNKVIPLSDRQLLDLGTGTGFFPIYFAKKGMESVGMDISKEMISIARKNAERQEVDNVKFKKGDFTRLRMDENFDYVTMFFDVINNITDSSKINRLFTKVYDILTPGGYYFFDLLSIWGMKKMWGNDSFIEYYDDFHINWYSNWNNDKQLLKVTMKIVSDMERITETFYEKGYPKNSMVGKLESTGFKVKTVTPIFFFKKKPSRYIFWCEK